MKLLAFETATEACSVAVYVDGEVRERFEIAPRRHAELALPWAEQLLAEAGIARSQLDAVALSRGPGAFTGVRLAFGRSIGLVSVTGWRDRRTFMPSSVSSSVANSPSATVT